MRYAVRSVLLQELSAIPDEEVAVLLSGGVDSCSVLFALLELGKKVTAYSFTLDDRISTDYVSAHDVAEVFGVPFYTIVLPTDVSTLCADVKTLISVYECRKKTEVECAWPMYYASRAIKERFTVAGLGADGHFGISKKAMIHYRHTVEKLDEFREALFNNPNYAQQQIVRYIFANQGKFITSPYLSERMIRLFRGSSWEDINKPHEKQPILDSYPEQFAKIKIRKHTNFQKGDSGIAEQFEKLLQTDLNRRGHKSVVGIYNDLAKYDIKETQSKLF